MKSREFSRGAVQERTTDEQEVRVKNLTKKDRARRKKFEAMGLDFEFDGYAAKIPAKPAHKKCARVHCENCAMMFALLV